MLVAIISVGIVHAVAALANIIFLYVKVCEKYEKNNCIRGYPVNKEHWIIAFDEQKLRRVHHYSNELDL